MSKIQPFNALRPAKELAFRLASRPYDVLNRKEAAQEAKGNEVSFYHISKAEIDLPESVDDHSEQVYQQAASNLKHFLEKGYLFRESKPCYYIYQLTMNGHSQTGLVCVSSVAEYQQNLIKKHELTRPDKEQDRINHMRALKAQTGNVFLAYNSTFDIDSCLESWKQAHQPEYDFTTADGVQHTVWVVDDAQVIQKITDLFDQQIPCTYIADGHHRAASASLVQKAFLREGRITAENSPVNFFLTTLFPAQQLSILDYNRVVKDLNGWSKEAFLSNLQIDFVVTSTGGTPVKPSMLHEFGMYLEGEWFRLTAKEGTYEVDPIGILDVSILQKNVLDRWLDIQDPRTDNRIDFVGGIRGLEELVKRVDSGEMKVAFSLYPVSIQQLFEIADSGTIMPPKSTWFEPKLRDGLLSHSIE